MESESNGVLYVVLLYQRKLYKTGTLINAAFHKVVILHSENVRSAIKCETSEVIQSGLQNLENIA